MHVKTKAIILCSIKYSDSSVIVHAYTEEFGRVAYVVNGVKSKKSAIKPAFLIPLSIVEIEAEHHPKKELQRIKESKISYHFNKIPYDAIRNSIAILLSEILFRCLKETDKNPSLFDFLHQSVVLLDEIDCGIANFHLFFLVQLSSFLGFYPNADNKTDNTYFDLLNGCFLREKPLHKDFLSVTHSNILKSFLTMNIETIHLFSCSRKEKNEMLESLIKYYHLHLSNFGQIKSLKVLHDLFD